MGCAQGCGGTCCGCTCGQSCGYGVTATQASSGPHVRAPALPDVRISHIRIDADGHERLLPYKPWMDCQGSEPSLHSSAQEPDDDDLRAIWEAHPHAQTLLPRERLHRLIRKRARRRRMTTPAPPADAPDQPRRKGPTGAIHTTPGWQPSTWDGCSAPPKRSSGCRWRLQDYVARLWDPYHISCADALAGTGTPEERDLGWWLHTSSTCTVDIGGVQRMYFQHARLGTLCDSSPSAWPVFDATDTSEKFAWTEITTGNYIQRNTSTSPTLLEWWRAAGGGDYDGDGVADDVTTHHFCSEYISFLDSEQDGTFRLWAPGLTTVSDPRCWVDAPVSYSGTTASGKAFRAGWNSTEIRCSGDTTVYRDVSVVYLPSIGYYALFAVECSSPYGVAEDTSRTCSICTTITNPDCASGAMPAASPTNPITPTTRYVFFLSRSPNFQASIASIFGPFDALPSDLQPDLSSSEWFGTPHTLIDPDGAVLLTFFARRSDTARNGNVYSCLTDEFELYCLLLLFLPFLGASSPFRLPVRLSTTGVTPSSDERPSVNDPHLVFSPEGDLHLYFANSYSTSSANPNLELVSHAIAARSYNSDAFVSYLEADSFVATAYAEEMVGTFRMASCDPLCMPRILDGRCAASTTRAYVNDPEVYLDNSGTYRMNFLSQQLNGLVYATADTDGAFAS